VPLCSQSPCSSRTSAPRSIGWCEIDQVRLPTNFRAASLVNPRLSKLTNRSPVKSKILRFGRPRRRFRGSSYIKFRCLIMLRMQFVVVWNGIMLGVLLCRAGKLSVRSELFQSDLPIATENAGNIMTTCFALNADAAFRKCVLLCLIQHCEIPG
jgi:hypothetical protein